MSDPCRVFFRVVSDVGEISADGEAWHVVPCRTCAERGEHDVKIKAKARSVLEKLDGALEAHVDQIAEQPPGVWTPAETARFTIERERVRIQRERLDLDRLRADAERPTQAPTETWTDQEWAELTDEERDTLERAEAIRVRHGKT